MADHRLRRSLDDFNDLVRQAQERSVSERRPYLLFEPQHDFSSSDGSEKGRKGARCHVANAKRRRLPALTAGGVNTKVRPRNGFSGLPEIANQR